MKRFLAVVIIPQKTSEVKKFKITIEIFILLLVLFVGALALSGWLYYKYFNLKGKLFDLDAIRQNVTMQENDLRFFREELALLQLEYDQIEREASKLKRLTSVEAENVPVEEDREMLQRLEQDSSISILDLIHSKDQSQMLGETSVKLKIRNLLDYIAEVRNPFASIPDAWPAKGYLISGFGFETEPFSDKTNLNGIVIGTHPDTPVRAPADGIVVYAGTEEKFGKTLKIYHTNMLVSKFGYLSKYNLELGDKVRKGEILGVAGPSKNLNVPQVYYEITINGIPQNPIQYIQSE